MIRILLSLLFVFSYSAAAAAGTFVYTSEQNQNDKDSASCTVRFLSPIAVDTISAKVDGTSKEVGNLRTYPQQGENTAFLFFVDVSNPKRKQTVKNNAVLIGRVVEASVNNATFGLASFSGDIKELCPISSDKETFLKKLPELKANGSTTEFYRTTIEAINILKKTKATRKILALFSDGVPEDTAYNHEDVIEAAKQAGIIIWGIGCAESVRSSVYLQSVRRLAEETDGIYTELIKNDSDQSNEVNIAFELLNGGVEFDINIAGIPKNAKLEVIITDKKGKEFSEAGNIVVSSSMVVNPMMLGGGGLLVLIIAGLLLKKKKNDPIVLPGKCWAKLEVQGRVDGMIELTQPIVRIGRNDENDIVFLNNSVSGYHAEIHQRRGGEANITDLNSTNGIFVNGSKIHSTEIKAGDLIEIGEVKIRFHEV